MTRLADTIYDLTDDHLILNLKTMRRLGASDRPHWCYNNNLHLALKAECERRGLEICDE